VSGAARRTIFQFPRGHTEEMAARGRLSAHTPARPGQARPGQARRGLSQRAAQFKGVKSAWSENCRGVIAYASSYVKCRTDSLFPKMPSQAVKRPFHSPPSPEKMHQSEVNDDDNDDCSICLFSCQLRAGEDDDDERGKVPLTKVHSSRLETSSVRNFLNRSPPSSC